MSGGPPGAGSVTAGSAGDDESRAEDPNVAGRLASNDGKPDFARIALGRDELRPCTSFDALAKADERKSIDDPDDLIAGRVRPDKEKSCSMK